MTQIFTILFDLDGTIIDTAPDLIVAHDNVMKKFGHKIEQSVDIKKNVWRGAWMMMQKSLKEKNVNQVIRNEMTKEFINFYSKNIANGSKPIKGLFEFLDWAKSKNISMAICTNKQERLAVQLLKKLNLFEYFEYIAGHDTFAFNKPDPRHLTNVVEIIGGDLKKTIMVGDSEIDEMAAVNAKLPFVLIANGYT